MANPFRVWIEGGGVAAAALATLLARRGIDVALRREDAGPSRIVAIPRATALMLHDLLGIDIERRVRARLVVGRRVAWEEVRFVEVAAPALICDVRDLVSCIVDGMPRDAVQTSAQDASGADWIVLARGRGRNDDRGVAAGERAAVVGSIPSLPSFDTQRTLVAAVPDGWLFAAAHPESGIALTLVQPPGRLTESEPAALTAAVDALWPGHGRTASAGGARVHSAPCLDLDCARPGHMTVGDSAFAIDPLRGDGVGFAIRGALLAQSVLGAIARERSVGPYLTHYAARLRHAFCRHVDECVSHYERAWNAAIWQGEIAKMRRSRRLVADVPPLRFRLDHLDLAPA